VRETIRRPTKRTRRAPSPAGKEAKMKGSMLPLRLVGVIAATGLLAIACGDTDDEGAARSEVVRLREATTTETTTTETTGPGEATTTETTTTETTGPGEVTTTETVTSASSASSIVALASDSDAPTVDDLEQALEVEIEARYPDFAPGQVTCDASGALSDWQPIICSYLPDVPVEFGGIHVSMLDGGRYNWALGPCCDSGPSLDAYPTGLFCRDLVEPPPGLEDRYLSDSDHLAYGMAVFYWLTEGRPDRMDADSNGVPCETVYPAGEVSDFWDAAPSL
jgi:hypothetical protein